MIDEDAKAANVALVSFLQAFARMIELELQKQPGTRVEEAVRTDRARKLLTAKETADFLQVRLSRVYEISHWKEPNRLRCVRIGRQIRFRMEDIEAYLQRQARGGL